MKLGQLLKMVAVVATLGCVAAGCAPTAGGTWQGADCGLTPNIGPGVSLFGCDLSGVSLVGVDLSGADLRGAVLIGANLSNANLSGANLEGANLTNANLTGANLTGAVLAGAILVGALFVNALLGGVSFDFGAVYGPTGTGGGAPSGSSCVGTYCPGYNGANIDTGHPLCAEDVGSNGGFGDWFYVYQSPATLASQGLRSVVVDGSTSFAGALFDYSNQQLPAIVTLRGLNWSTADFSNATFINAGFGCQSGTGARFGGATFVSQGAGGNASHWYSVDFKNSDFSNTHWTGVVMSAVDLSGSDLSNSVFSNLGLENQTDFNSDGVSDDGYTSPAYLLKLDGTNLTGTRMGLDVNPGTGSSAMVLSGEFNGNPFRSTSFAGANLTGAQLANMTLRGADLSGVIATGATVHGASYFDNATFEAGWSGSSWPDVFSPSYSFTGATCPDGSAYSPVNLCLPL